MVPLEAGRRYRLTVTLRGEGPGEQQIDTITLPTSSRKHGVLEIKAFSKIRDRVYAFPDAIELDTIDSNYLKARPQMVGFLAKNITVFQAGGDDFKATVETDVPFLRVSMQNLGAYKDRVGINVSVEATKLKSGAVNGSVTVLTNDPKFPKLVIPVSGVVQGNW